MNPAINGLEPSPKMAQPLYRLALAALVLTTWTTAPAMAGCTWDDLVQDGAQVASVAEPAARIHFVRDATLKPGCPGPDAACRSAAFVVPGDVVLTGPAQNGFTCTGFVSTKGATTIGWLPAAALHPLPEGEQRPGNQLGRWVAPEKEVTTTAGPGNALRVKGFATRGDTPERRLSGGVHTGEVEGEATPAEGALAFTMGEDGRTMPFQTGKDDGCSIRMGRRGLYLLARDNMGCGRANVSFSDFYRRANR